MYIYIYVPAANAIAFLSATEVSSTTAVTSLALVPFASVAEGVAAGAFTGVAPFYIYIFFNFFCISVEISLLALVFELGH